MTLFQERICATDGKQLPVVNGVQSGYYCCDEYYCSKPCLDKSFENSGTTWDEHYSDDGDCYFSGWDEEYDEDGNVIVATAA